MSLHYTKKYHPDSSPLDSYSLNHITKKYHPDSKAITIRLLQPQSHVRSTKKYHPDSKSITIRLLQPQSHVAPLRNIILIQSQSPLDSYSLNHMSLH